jgi:hypothetical protein
VYLGAQYQAQFQTSYKEQQITGGTKSMVYVNKEYGKTLFAERTVEPVEPVDKEPELKEPKELEGVDDVDKDMADWLIAEKDFVIASNRTAVEDAVEKVVNITGEMEKMVDAVDVAKWLLAEKDECIKADVSRVKAGEAYLADKKSNTMKFYRLSKMEPGKEGEVDTNFIERMLDLCGDNIEMIAGLEKEYEALAIAKFPDVRRSTGEEDVPGAGAKPPMNDDEGTGATEIHGKGGNE